MDRCDRCCARARYEWWKAEGRRTVALCGHHSKQHGAALVAAGFLALPALEDADHPRSMAG